MDSTKKGPDRRTLVTKNLIKDAMLRLLRQDSFDKISVAALCREANVGRATFAQLEFLSDQVARMEKASELERFVEFLPLCQRVADDPRYKPLFRDDQIAEYIIMRVYRQECPHIVPEMMREMHITQRQGELLFLYSVMGAFAVNRSLRWNKDETWYEMQRMILTYAHAGNEAVIKLGQGR